MTKERTRTQISRAAALAAALLVCTGCVATKRDVRDLRAEIQALSARQDSILVALSRQNAVTQDTLRRQTDQLFEIRGDVSRQLQNILDEISRIGELTGQNQRAIASMRDQLEGLRRAPAPVADPAPGGGESVMGGGGGGSDPDGTYAAALRAYRSNQLTTAQRAFDFFLEDSPGHPLVPEARYYLADILVQQGKPEEAIAAFNEIPEMNPTSPKVPEALYRVALLEIERGNETTARRLLDRVVNTYPDSDAAGLAREKLREIR